MNLLIFIYSLGSGGAERVTVNLANYWAKRGWKITIVTLASQPEDFYKLHSGVRRIAFDLAGDSAHLFAAVSGNLRRILALRRVLRETQPDIALAMMSTANVLLALAATGLKGVATVGSERTYPPQIPLGAVWEVLRARLYGRLSTVVALTRESAAWLSTNTQTGKVVVIPNAVPWPLSSHLPHLEPPVWIQGSHMLLAVGRLSEEKGFDLLIHVFQRLAGRFPDWRLAILGEGPERESLQAQIEAAGLGNRIALPGVAGNVGEWYAAADLYVMSSRFEGFPNTLVEALAYGLPVVSFDCDTGPRDIIRHGVDGLLVPAGDGAGLEEAMGRLMGDEALRQQFSGKAVEVRERFSIERIAGLWEQMFREVSNG